MKTIHIKEIGFLLHHGLIDIGRSYKLDIWAIELRWVCPFLNPWSFRIWSGRQKPAKGLIAICIVLSPGFMFFHWAIIVPIYATIFAICLIGAFLGMSLTFLGMSLGYMFSWIGNKLKKIGEI